MDSVLIVEDEVVTAMDLEACLRSLDYDVVGAASSGAEAIALAAARQPDLILMDVHLQGEIDGIDAARTIAAEQQIPVVFMSAIDSDDVVRRALAAAPFGYIVKPYREVQLRVTIETAINSARLQRRGKRDELRLRQTQATVDSAPIAILWLGIGNRVAYTNRQAQMLLGYSAEELQGMRAERLEVREKRSTEDPQVATGEFDFETVAMRKDGSTFPARVCAYGLQAAGSPIVVCHVEDLTARRRAESALRHSEQMARVIMEAARDCIFCKGRDLRYTFVNAAMERLLGQPAAEIIGHTAEEVFGPEAAVVISAVDEPVLAGETVDALRTLGIGGQTITFHTIQTPIRRGDDVVGICGVVRDVTGHASPEPGTAVPRSHL